MSGIEFEQRGDIVENSSFRNANLQYVMVWGEFTNCNFSGANILFKLDGSMTVRNCNFRGAQLKFTSWTVDETVDWKQIDSLGEFERPTFVNCTMPDGSKRNDPEP